MKNILIGLVAATSLVFGTGCGGSTCEKLVDSLAEFSEKGEACFEDSEPPTDQQKEDAIETCEASIDECSDEDQEKIEELADCLADVDECEAGQEDEYSGKLFACALQIGTLSDSCNVAFGGTEE